ncbi:hypothetical protein [Simkania sp.]|uniref:hypothetical protein n=1 Tax=Simkania sp. TaxID=34094 RepID=UPI003B52219B
MKKWLALLFLMGGTSLSYAQYGSSSSGQNNNPYQSSRYGQQSQQQMQQQQGQSPCASLQSTDPEAYAFSQQLSPIHQSVFCQQFTAAQRKQAMALAGSPTQDIQGKAGSITPDMAVEVVMQTARYSHQQQQQQPQQQNYSNYQQQQQQSYSYPNQNQNNNRSSGGRYSNY